VQSSDNLADMFTGATAMVATYSSDPLFGTSGTPSYLWFNQEPPYPCFLEGTKIETERGLVEVQHLRKGDKIKTFQDGFKRIKHIGTRPIRHGVSQERIKDQLYVCPKSLFPEATEDLVVTGCHSLLIDREFHDEKERQEVIRVNGETYVTDGMWRFPACILKGLTHVYPHAGTYNIYHLALENKDYYMNYGIYANGILAETSSIRYMRELSNMKFIGEDIDVFSENKELLHNQMRLLDIKHMARSLIDSFT